MSVGGGFTGFVVSLQIPLNPSHLAASLALGAGIACTFLFIMGAGLAFALNPRRTRPIFIAIGLQVPWISSPFITCRFVAGFGFYVGFIGDGPTWHMRLGADAMLYFDSRLPWGIGINLFAVMLLVLMVRAIRADAQPGPAEQFAAADEASPALPTSPNGTAPDDFIAEQLEIVGRRMERVRQGLSQPVPANDAHDAVLAGRLQLGSPPDA